MKNISLFLVIFITTVFFTGCVPTEKRVIEKSPKFTEVNVIDNGCGTQLNEASDLAFNDKDNILYIVGDKGKFYKCSVDLKEDSITLDFISSESIIHDFASVDAEGLSMNSQTNELILSTEGNDGNIYPLSKYGVINGKYELPDILKDASYKSANKKFEALTYHNDLGTLTAVEQPINGIKNIDQTIYNMHGDSWSFKAENYREASVTAIETTSDGNLLVLERAVYKSVNFYITIKKLILNEECKNKSVCSDEVLYKAFWEGGNFEGMTKINDTYLIVNDGQARFDSVFKAFKID